MLNDIASVHEGGRHRIKDAEKAAIYQEIYRRRRATRKQIAAALSSRPTTVSRAVQELIEDGLVETLHEPAPARPRGRPEIHLQPRLARYTALVIQGVSRRLKGVLVDLGYRTLAEAETRLDEKAGNDELEAGLSELTADLAGRNPAGSSLLCAGLCLPGTVNGREERWISAARWPGLDRLALSTLARRAGARLSIQRALDAELEYLLVNTPAYRRGNTLLFHWGYGIGSAYAHQGRVLRSTLGRFGEIGHVRLKGTGDKPCFCGSCGCLETEAALWALLPELRRRQPDTPEDEDLFAARLAGQRLLQDLPAVRRAAAHIRTALDLVYQVIYPDRILLFGPFFQSDELFTLLAEGFQDGLPAYARGSVSLERIASGRMGAVVGSSHRFFREALKKDLIARWET
jgi:predicted NBD/HSP70 family sugar kinase